MAPELGETESTNLWITYFSTRPVTSQEDFVNAIGYLIRRLDENTGPETTHP
ncbi:MAG: hypothetical protein GY811_10985 [Myxococcales bacterium]|nr:hypothetical protein [Myxococcales bacterium]